MISNLHSARALIQADLEHARNVLQLWQHQVGELEQALAQLDAVDASRAKLQVPYQKGGAALLGSPSGSDKRGRKSKRGNAAASQEGPLPGKGKAKTEVKVPRKRAAKPALEGVTKPVGKSARSSRGTARKSTSALPVKFQDPVSGKTWGGRGRRPAWMSGDPDQYLITNRNTRNAGNPDTAEPANEAVS